MFGNHKLWEKQTFFMYGFLVISAVTVDLAASGGGTGNSGTQPTPPTITYTCAHNVIDNITVSDAKYDNIKVKQGADKYCKRSLNGKAGLLECLTGKLNLNHAKLLYEDVTDADVFGGKIFFYFDLACDEKTAIKNATLKLTNKFSSTTNPPSRTTLKADQHNSEVPTLSVTPMDNLYVGEDLKLTMKMTDTNAGYLLSPQECYAHRPGNTDKINIWKCSTQASHPNIIKQAAWTKDVEAGFASVSIQMFAFKFIDSPDVVIECSAKVCPVTPGTECDLTKCSLPVGRKRRQVVTKKMDIPIKHASVSFEVKDQFFTRNSVSGLATRWYSYAVPAFLLIGSRLYL